MPPIFEPPGALVRVGDERRAQHDELVGEHTMGGPLDTSDRRLYLDAATLRRLLELAEASSVRRVQIDGAGVRIRSWRDRHGHVFETWQIIGRSPQPERHTLLDGGSK